MSLHPAEARRAPSVVRSSAVSLLALAGALACGEQPAPTGPDFAKMAVPLTATPSSLDFASPAATPQTLTATVQYTGLVTATSASCATVSPVSVPAAKPAGSSVYLASFTVTPAAVGTCILTLTDKKGVRLSVPRERRRRGRHVLGRARGRRPAVPEPRY